MMLLLLLACRPDATDPKTDDSTPTIETGEGLFLQGCPIEGQATARLLEDEAERPWGEEGLAAPGDVLLLSSKAAFVIQGPENPRTYYHYGGAPIDAVAVSGCEQAGPERLEEVGFVIGQLDLLDFSASTLRQIRADSLEVVSDGSDGGPAIVELHGTDDRFWLVELTLVRGVYEGGGYKSMGDLYGLDITLRYTLEPDSALLQAEVLIDGEPVEDGFIVGALVFPSDLTSVHAFASDALSVGGFNMDLGVPWLAMGSAEGSVAVAMPGAATAYTEVAGVRALLDANHALVPLEVSGPGEPVSTPFLFGVGATDAASASATLEPLLTMSGQEITWSDLAGTVVDPAGQPIAGATVEVYAEATTDDWRLLDQLVTDSTGAFSGRTLSPLSTWKLVATAPGRDHTEEVTLAPGGSTTLSMGAQGSLQVDVVDAAGDLIPARVELERTDGADVVAYALPGETLAVAPGTYNVWVSRGYTWSIVQTTVTVPEDGTGTLAVSLTAQLDTTGWASMDSHVHAEPSADSTTLAADRMRTAAAAGLDAVISTDHEAIIDLSPAITAAGLDDELVYALGSEVTATVPEHINAWPFPVTDDDRGSPVRWYQMGFPGIYAAIRERGAQVVQLNHSRVNNECGILCILDWDRQSEPTIADPTAIGLPAGTEVWSWDFDSFEVINGLRSPYLDPANPRRTGALVDWLSFHNLGHRVTGVAVTDVHGLEIPGSPRNWVAVTDAASFDAQDLADGVLSGAVVISAGAFADVSIAGAGPGETATGAEVSLALHVEALPEIDVDSVVVLVNCDAVTTVATTDPAGVVKLDTTVPLSLSADAYIVTIGHGDSAMPRGLEDYDGTAVPRFITNPIFVDADGDGAWTAPGPKECATGLVP